MRKREREREDERKKEKKTAFSNMQTAGREQAGEATRFHGARTREDPPTFFQYEAQRDEQVLRVGLRKVLLSRMQKYLRALVKRPFMHV